MATKKNTQILTQLIQVLKDNGVTIDSPYDFENWMYDHAKHSDLFETKQFYQDELDQSS